MSSMLDTCVLCPRLCRPACPVATGTGREAAVPTLIATMAKRWRDRTISKDLAIQALALCVDCGACERHCHIGHPLPALLKEVRRELRTWVPVEPLRPLIGEGTTVAIEVDERPWGDALATWIGEPVRRWATGDHLGWKNLGLDGWANHVDDLIQHVSDRELVVADGAVAEVLDSARVTYTWLHDKCPQLADGQTSCASDSNGHSLGCCGAAGNLYDSWPEDALLLADRWLRVHEDTPVQDTRCRNHLRRTGAIVRDSVDRILELVR